MYKRLLRSSAATLLLTTGLCSAVSVMAEQTGERCGTQVRTANEKIQSEARFATTLQTSFKAFPPVNQPITVPIAFHIIYMVNQNGNEVGNISDETINKQITTLNDAYTGTGIQFSLAEITRTRNIKWFRGCLEKPVFEKIYKRQLAVDPAHNLNVYTCQAENLLGFASFPDAYAEDSYMHGIVLNHTTLPGNPLPFGLGDTAVHEIGHYFGLYHTFLETQTSCNIDNDLVDDTAIERSPARGCPTKRDTCVTKLDKDPITNYMDYTDDICMSDFTIGQIKRMQEQIVAFKPSLLP